VTEPPEQPFDEESLSRALSAPGSESELREEQKYVGMFRSAKASPAPGPVHLAPRRHRTVSRFGAGTAFVVALAVGGSAAAAYTNHLPEPIQQFAHRALGPVAPPPPEPKHHAKDHVAKDVTSPTPTPSETDVPSSTSSPSQPPSHSPSPSATPSHSPKPTPTPSGTPSATTTPSATPTPTPTTQPTPTPTETPTTPTPTLVPALPAALSISGSTHKAEPGQSVAFAGVVTSDGGDPVRRAKVALQLFSGSWSTLATARTDSSGAVSLVLPPVTATTAVRLRTTNGVHSSRWRVTLHPELSVTSSSTDDQGAVVITVRATGAQPGDRVQLLTKSGQVASGTLGADGSVSFSVTPTTRRTRYIAQLAGTSAHGPDHASITVVVKKPTGRVKASSG
jgi:outer membrane biosynthesis protein TonB